jgi:hypothetical protein
MSFEEFQMRREIMKSQRTYDRNTFLWGPENGDPILAKDLTMSHLCNIINWILNHENQYDDGVLDFMIGEAEYRKLPAFVSNQPYIVTEGVKFGGRERAQLVNT